MVINDIVIDDIVIDNIVIDNMVIDNMVNILYDEERMHGKGDIDGRKN